MEDNDSLINALVEHDRVDNLPHYLLERTAAMHCDSWDAPRRVFKVTVPSFDESVFSGESTALLYHGTRDAHGVLMGGIQCRQSHDHGWYGRGVYFSHDISTASDYAHGGLFVFEILTKYIVATTSHVEHVVQADHPERIMVPRFLTLEGVRSGRTQCAPWASDRCFRRLIAQHGLRADVISAYPRSALQRPRPNDRMHPQAAAPNPTDRLAHLVARVSLRERTRTMQRAREAHYDREFDSDDRLTRAARHVHAVERLYVGAFKEADEAYRAAWDEYVEPPRATPVTVPRTPFRMEILMYEEPYCKVRDPSTLLYYVDAKPALECLVRGCGDVVDVCEVRVQDIRRSDLAVVGSCKLRFRLTAQCSGYLGQGFMRELSYKLFKKSNLPYDAWPVSMFHGEAEEEAAKDADAAQKLARDGEKYTYFASLFAKGDGVRKSKRPREE